MNHPETFDIGLSLLDRQLVGSKDELFGNVDNAVLESVAGELAVTALVTGPAGLAPRFGGRIEVWMRAVWRRLRPEGDPAPILIPMSHVVEMGAAVTLDERAQQDVSDGAQLERWLRHYLVGRVPGATGGPDRLSGEPLGPAEPRADRAAGPALDTLLLVSDLLGATVLDTHGNHLGVVLDLCADPPHPNRHRVGPLAIRAVLYGPRRLGAELGYTTQRDQGPWIIAAPLRAWHRADRIVPVDDVDVDVDVSRPDTVVTITVTGSGQLRHPHQPA